MSRSLLTGLGLALAFAAPASALEAPEPGHVPAAPFVAPAEAFPIEGEVDYGRFANEFGGGRGHQGHDVFADCGTPVVAARAGRVLVRDYHGAAGNYVVMRVDGGRSHVYAHLRAPSRVREGDQVEAGERLGSVGDTGNAWDCHLHFEVWTAPGWYRGGRAIDPKPFLTSLPKH